MDQFFSSLFRETENDWPLSSFGTSLPATNLWEKDDAFFLEMEVPGVKPEQIDLSVLGDQLTLKVERETEEEEEQGNYLRRERHADTATRVLTLPADVNPEDVEATMENGILSVRLGKAKEAMTHKIKVSQK
jgi:HSP20 family protein